MESTLRVALCLLVFLCLYELSSCKVERSFNGATQDL
jgi:hypothetical protein